MSYQLASVVVPVYRQRDHIEAVVRTYLDALEKLPVPHELLLVNNGPDDGSLATCNSLAASHASVHVTSSPPGWGEAVQEGLAAATGDLLCFTNSARTTAEDLLLALLYAVTHPGVVIKATRKTRDSLHRRLGSLLYNLECRLLFDLANFDLNGTPKVFPRDFQRLLELQQRDDLIDLEFNVACRIEGYPMLEVPISSTQRHGGASTTNYRSAVKMYWGALQLWRDLRSEITLPPHR